MPTYREDLHSGSKVPLWETDDISNRAIIEEKMADNSVSTRTIQDSAVTPEKLNPRVKAELIDPEVSAINRDIESLDAKYKGITDAQSDTINGLQNQIDSLERVGYVVDDKLGNNDHISVSQKVITDAINKLWQKIEEITGEVIQGFNMVVTPTFFVSDDGCDVHVAANTTEANGVFEWIEFWVDGVCEKRYENVRYIDPEECVIHLENKDGYDYLIECKAQIMGIEYPPYQQVITRYSEFLMFGATDAQLQNIQPFFIPANTVPIPNSSMRVARDVTLTNNQHIVIVLGESLKDGFIRADLNGIEIPFTQTTATVDGKNYAVFTSEDTYIAGTYNIDVNG